MTGVERILERALHLVRGGQRSPFAALCMAEQVDSGDSTQDPARALLAVMAACGGTLTEWYEFGPRRSQAETVQIFEDALFAVQVGGA